MEDTFDTAAISVAFVSEIETMSAAGFLQQCGFI
jgi:hypothetical protein